MASRDRRIVLLGKTGAGKSSAGNIIFGGEKVFNTSSSHYAFSKTCTPESKIIKGRTVTLIDTPGFLDTRISEDEQTPDISNCMTECAGGVHAFLIVLKVERFTVHEREICTKIQQSFSDNAFKYATVLFTHGDDLEGKTIQDFVKENDELSELVQKCGGRCHVIDNKHWNQGRWFRNSINQVQVSELLKTIDQTVQQNRGGCYTNEMLQAVQEDIQAEEKTIREKSGGELSEEEIHRQAKKIVETRLYVRLAGMATAALLGAVIGALTATIPFYLEVARAVGKVNAITGATTAATETGYFSGTWLSTAAKGIPAPAKYMFEVGAVVGGIAGGIVGYNTAEGKETAEEAVKAAATAVYYKAKAVWDAFTF